MTAKERAKKATAEIGELIVKLNSELGVALSTGNLKVVAAAGMAVLSQINAIVEAAIIEAQREAREECAKIADEQAEMRFEIAERSSGQIALTHRFTAEACLTVAKEIRALKD